MKKHVWDVHQEWTNYKSAISVFQAIVCPNYQAPKYFDSIKRLQQNGF